MAVVPVPLLKLRSVDLSVASCLEVLPHTRLHSVDVFFESRAPACKWLAVPLRYTHAGVWWLGKMNSTHFGGRLVIIH